jgi:hypothetical protein
MKDYTKAIGLSEYEKSRRVEFTGDLSSDSLLDSSFQSDSTKKFFDDDYAKNW